MKQLLLILLALTCVLFSAPAGGNGADEETTELPSIESPGSKNGDDEEERTDDLQKKTGGATSQKETMPSTNSYGPNAILRDFINQYGENELPLLLAVLAVSLALMTRQAILGFLKMPKLVFLISICLSVFAGMFVWSSDMENKWMVLLETLILVVSISGMLVYCCMYLLPKLEIGLFVLVVSVTLPVVLGVANDVLYDIGIAEFFGIGGGVWLIYRDKEHDQLISAWNNFRNQSRRRKSGKDEKEGEKQEK